MVRICVALSVGVVVGIEVVLVDVVSVVVVVRVADQHVDDVEDRKEEGDDAECAHAAAGSLGDPTFSVTPWKPQNWVRRRPGRR